MKHSAEFQRCMIEMDVVQARKLWAEVFPHLVQPATDEDMRLQLHLARTMSKQVPLRLRLFSKQWLSERAVGRIAAAVGIAVLAPKHRAHIAKAIGERMTDSVQDSIKQGLDVDTDAAEVKRRMLAARAKEWAGR